MLDMASWFTNQTLLIIGATIVGIFVFILMTIKIVEWVKALLETLQAIREWLVGDFTKNAIEPIKKDVTKVLDQQSVILRHQETQSATNQEHSQILMQHSQAIVNQSQTLLEHTKDIVILQNQVFGGRVQLDIYGERKDA